MEYALEYRYLHKEFSQAIDVKELPEAGVVLHNFSFESKHQDFLPGTDASYSLLSDESFSAADSQINENRNFRYSVFTPPGCSKAGDAIIMLHGLNERDWDKYLPWAAALTRQTGKPVILFPISFHMNRAPSFWTNPRIMVQVAQIRERMFKHIKHHSFANAALSDRLQANPKRFMLSGIESYYDILALVSTIKEGRHPLFKAGASISFFSYSIGAFLTELFIMANPRNYFSDSKAFLFCGGATFDQMNGVSRFILDSKAGASLHSFFIRHFKRELKHDPQMRKIVENTKVGVYFHSLLRYKRKKGLREKRLAELGPRIKAIALQKDKVMPPRAVIRTLQGKRHKIPITVDVLDYFFPYYHEQPFPVGGKFDQGAVNAAFQQLFLEASLFLK